PKRLGRRLTEAAPGTEAETLEAVMHQVLESGHEMLTCEVSDTGHCYPLVRHPRTTDEHGHGLFLVTQLSHRWGTRQIPDDKLIWAEQQLPAIA
ncbi:ATP-binding protein, partial [Streptomyces sp. NPDC051896]|uniref:ATP-binding protein n=1 Tax=Streptomyces sp. NPDC051896 TaxID=3155416 RepID=UPI00342599FF